MTEEAEVAAAAPEQSSAPEAKTDEAPKPGVAEPEQNGTDTADNAASETEESKDAEPAGAETDEEGDEPQKPKKRTSTSRLRAKIREISTEAEDLRRQLAERDSERKPPKEEDFNGNYEAFNRAMTAFDTAELLRKDQFEDRKRDIAARQREIAIERDEIHQERMDEARKLIPDFDAKLKGGLNINVPKDNLGILMESEKSALIAYHFAENPARVKKFAGMTTLEAAKEVGRLEAQLSLPKPKTKTEAPAPVQPPKGGLSPTKSLADADMEEYVRLRKQEAERKAS